MTTVTELWIYPVKGLAGISLEQAQLTPTGLKWDRHWMVVDDKGRFVTQRQLPQMASITTALDDQQLLLTHPSMPPLSLSLADHGSGDKPVKVWDSELSAKLMDHAGQWLTQALQSPRALHLVRFDEAQVRDVSAKHLLDGERSHTQFADGYPVLVCNEQSLALLNQQLQANGQQTVPMSRFRGNVIVDEFGGAMNELYSAELRTDEWQLGIRKPCQRCPVTRVDQQTGQRMHPQEPLPSLTAINPMADKPGAFFGGNAIVVKPGVIRVGQALI